MEGKASSKIKAKDSEVVKMLNLFEANELIKSIKESNGAKLHLHDTCGGQYFTIDNGNEETISLIIEYLTIKKQKYSIQKDNMSFTVK